MIMTSKIRLAVIGAGHLGRIHARLAAGLPSFELVAIADPVQEAAESLAAEDSAPNRIPAITPCWAASTPPLSPRRLAIITRLG